MKRTLHLSSSILLALSCAQNPVEPPPSGGQSGDDGDVVPGPPGGPPPMPVPPGFPQQQPCEPEESEHALDAATPFGGSALQLLARVAPDQDEPLFWVPFNSLAGTRFTTAASETRVSLSLTARSGETATQTAWRPKYPNATCPDEALRVPVSVHLTTADRAFDEQVDSVLELSSGHTAHLAVELPGALAGSFGFDQIGAPGANWEVEGFQLEADFWPGGSHGEIRPSFTLLQVGPPSPPSVPSVSPPHGATTGNGSPAPSLPATWRAIAVWPRRENCDAEPRGQAAAYSALDRVIGWSPADVVADLNGRSAWTLSSGQQSAPLQFTLDAPAGLQCVRGSGRRRTFDVLGRLRSDAPQGSALEHLNVSSVFELTVSSLMDGSGLESFRWVRRDVVNGQTRAAFEAATGLELAASDEYQQVWWSWHGTDTRQSATPPWAARGTLVVSSLNAAQSAAIARVMSEGGPGAGIAFDNETQFPELPGDTLIEAESSP